MTDASVEPDKDAFARIWDGMFGRHDDATDGTGNSGGESVRDRMHSAIVFVVIIAIAAAIIGCGWYIGNDYVTRHEAHVFVPSTTYTSDQASEVKSQLKSMGFRDPKQYSNGIAAYGTKSMCKKWRDSFWQTNVRDNVSVIDDKQSTELLGVGIYTMSHDDGWRNLTIKTLTSDSSTSVLGYVVSQSQTVSKAIDAAAQWCSVLHDGRKIHVSFQDRDGKEYWSTDADSENAIVVALQKRDKKAKKSSNENANEGKSGKADTNGKAGNDERTE